MSQVSRIYRQLLKTQKKTFENDWFMIKDARKHTRKLFDEHRDLSDPKAIQKQVKIAEQAETILRRNIVQANKQGDKYVLNITADKEVNYNDSIKDKKKQPAQKL